MEHTGGNNGKGSCSNLPGAWKPGYVAVNVTLPLVVSNAYKKGGEM